MNYELQRQALDRLIEKYYAIPEKERPSLSEDEVIQQFIRPFLRDVLGYPVDDIKRYRTELTLGDGRLDGVLLAENEQQVFIEAKKFGEIKRLDITRYKSYVVKPNQLTLPSMAKDRTRNEQQAINYAFENGGQWAILTNFETFRLFNARRDWLVLSFDTPRAYTEDFEFLMKLSYENILKGSLDELDGTRYRLDVDEDYLAFINEWREKLGQDLLTNRAQNEWLFHQNKPDEKLLREVIQRFIDRLVIIRFAEDHFVIRPTLEGIYNLGKTNIYVVLQNILRDFFRKFDELHNSALFAPHSTDKAHFTEKTILDFLEFLNKARYRAMPADILGNTYERYLGKRLVIENQQVLTRDNRETRKKQGSFYTPQPMVQFLVDRTLGCYLYATDDGTPTGQPIPSQIRKTSADIADLTIIDCASGSGSFLIYAYRVLAEFYQSEIKRLDTKLKQHTTMLSEAGKNSIEIEMEITPIRSELNRINNNYPRLILEKHLYGVDLDPQAAEVAVVNLMMRALEGQQKQAINKHLPLLLNQNIKVGNGLVGVLPSEISADDAPKLARLIALREELLTLDYGGQHDAVIADIASITNNLRETYSQGFVSHFTDLERTNPFHWGIEFPEVFFQVDGTPKPDGGFTIIIGNPPWEIMKPDVREFYAQYDSKIEKTYSRAKADTVITKLNKEYPEYLIEYTASTTNIEQTASYIRQSPHFTYQGRKGDPATHKMFMERAWSLLQKDGLLGYVVPSGIYSDLGTKELRQMLFDEGRMIIMAGLSNERAIFPSIHRSFKFTLLAVQKGGTTTSFPVTFRIGYEDYPSLSEDFDRDDVLREVLLHDKQSYFDMTPSIIKRFNPDTLSLMEFKSQQGIYAADKVYANHPRLGKVIDESWNIKFAREFDMTNDRSLFEDDKLSTSGIQRLPLYEGKMIHHFNAFFEEPQYWIDENRGAERLKNRTSNGFRDYRLGLRTIGRATDNRTLICTILPRNVFAGNSLSLAKIENPKVLLYCTAILNSFCLDWIMRMQGGANINLFIVNSLPVPRIDENHRLFKLIVQLSAQLVCIRPEFDDLWASLGDWVDNLPRATAPDLRDVILKELDAIIAHLYGIEYHEYLDIILKAFPLVFPNTPEGNKTREKYAMAYITVGNRLK